MEQAMKSSLAVISAVALAGALGAGAAHARGPDVQWSVTIGSPGWGGYARPAPVYVAPPVYYAPRPVVVYPRPIYYGGPGYWHRRDWDRDGDGIPNRHDRRYDPYGDRDRDGAPNRWDRDDRNPYRR
jgi:hypothetical protein